MQDKRAVELALVIAEDREFEDDQVADMPRMHSGFSSPPPESDDLNRWVSIHGEIRGLPTMKVPSAEDRDEEEDEEPDDDDDDDDEDDEQLDRDDELSDELVVRVPRQTSTEVTGEGSRTRRRSGVRTGQPHASSVGVSSLEPESFNHEDSFDIHMMPDSQSHRLKYTSSLSDLNREIERRAEAIQNNIRSKQTEMCLKWSSVLLGDFTAFTVERSPIGVTLWMDEHDMNAIVLTVFNTQLSDRGIERGDYVFMVNEHLVLHQMKHDQILNLIRYLLVIKKQSVTLMFYKPVSDYTGEPEVRVSSQNPSKLSYRATVDEKNERHARLIANKSSLVAGGNSIHPGDLEESISFSASDDMDDRWLDSRRINPDKPPTPTFPYADTDLLLEDAMLLTTENSRGGSGGGSGSVSSAIGRHDGGYIPPGSPRSRHGKVFSIDLSKNASVPSILGLRDVSAKSPASPMDGSSNLGGSGLGSGGVSLEEPPTTESVYAEQLARVSQDSNVIRSQRMAFFSRALSDRFFTHSKWPRQQHLDCLLSSKVFMYRIAVMKEALYEFIDVCRVNHEERVNQYEEELKQIAKEKKRAAWEKRKKQQRKSQLIRESKELKGFVAALAQERNSSPLPPKHVDDPNLGKEKIDDDDGDGDGGGVTKGHILGTRSLDTAIESGNNTPIPVEDHEGELMDDVDYHHGLQTSDTVLEMDESLLEKPVLKSSAPSGSTSSSMTYFEESLGLPLSPEPHPQQSSSKLKNPVLIEIESEFQRDWQVCDVIFTAVRVSADLTNDFGSKLRARDLKAKARIVAHNDDDHHHYDHHLLHATDSMLVPESVTPLQLSPLHSANPDPKSAKPMRFASSSMIRSYDGSSQSSSSEDESEEDQKDKEEEEMVELMEEVIKSSSSDPPILIYKDSGSEKENPFSDIISDINTSPDGMVLGGSSDDLLMASMTHRSAGTSHNINGFDHGLPTREVSFMADMIEKDRTMRTMRSVDFSTLRIKREPQRKLSASVAGAAASHDLFEAMKVIKPFSSEWGDISVKHKEKIAQHMIDSRNQGGILDEDRRIIQTVSLDQLYNGGVNNPATQGIIFDDVIDPHGSSSVFGFPPARTGLGLNTGVNGTLLTPGVSALAGVGSAGAAGGGQAGAGGVGSGGSKKNGLQMPPAHAILRSLYLSLSEWMVGYLKIEGNLHSIKLLHLCNDYDPPRHQYFTIRNVMMDEISDEKLHMPILRIICLDIARLLLKFLYYLENTYNREKIVAIDLCKKMHPWMEAYEWEVDLLCFDIDICRLKCFYLYTEICSELIVDYKQSLSILQLAENELRVSEDRARVLGLLDDDLVPLSADHNDVDVSDHHPPGSSGPSAAPTVGPTLSTLTVNSEAKSRPSRSSILNDSASMLRNPYRNPSRSQQAFTHYGSRNLSELALKD